MSCKIDLPFQQSASAALEKAKAAVLSQNGNFSGDIHSGDFDLNVYGNSIKGKYTIESQLLSLEITEKPFFVPCSMIESFLKNQLG